MISALRISRSVRHLHHGFRNQGILHPVGYLTPGADQGVLSPPVGYLTLGVDQCVLSNLSVPYQAVLWTIQPLPFTRAKKGFRSRFARFL